MKQKTRGTRSDWAILDDVSGVQAPGYDQTEARSDCCESVLHRSDVSMLSLSLRVGVSKTYSSCGKPRPCGTPLVVHRTLLSRRTMATSKGAQRLLPVTDAHLISLLNAACAHNWDRLPGLAREFYAAGGSSLELAATSRFVVTCVPAFMVARQT